MTQTRVPMVEILVGLERVRVICPACRQPVEAVARDGRVKGYCAVARQNVDFLIETQGRDAEYRAKIGAGMKRQWQTPEYRAKMGAIRKKRWQDPEYRVKMKKRWQR